MKIENLRSEKNGDRVRAVATVKWEDCDRPPYELYFETDEQFSQALSCEPQAFLIGCAIPAMHYGEKRIFIDAEICPELRTGLMTAMSLIRHWWGLNSKPLRIESAVRSKIPQSLNSKRAGFFFSGGIDSFATLLNNRLNFPLEHTLSIKGGLLVYGLELDSPEIFKYISNSLLVAAQKLDITLIPVYTNVYLEYRNEDASDHFRFWEYRFMGAALASIAHACSQGFTVVSIASSDDITNLHPYGSHPLLDSNYSSADLRICHDGISFSRLAKTKLVAQSDVALQHLRVCNQYQLYKPDMLNCGKCEKCLRTMLALLALGVLDKTSAFPTNEVSEELIWSELKLGKETHFYYKELLEPLAEKGRYDLIRAIEGKLRDYRKIQNGWRIKCKQFDQKYFQGKVTKFKRSIYSKRHNKNQNSNLHKIEK